jgi:hypothetical protein
VERELCLKTPVEGTSVSPLVDDNMNQMEDYMQGLRHPPQPFGNVIESEFNQGSRSTPCYQL